MTDDSVVDQDGGSRAKYTMTLSRLTIDKLGIRMYDRVAAVLAELVANAYDADAEDVEITLPLGQFLAPSESRSVDPASLDSVPLEGLEEVVREADEAASKRFSIVIEDDGHGMTAKEVNDHFLKVGRDRRSDLKSDVSRAKERKVMGRKGIGKLAPFGICRSIEVETAGGERTADGYVVSHLHLILGDVVTDTEEDYEPTIGERDGTFAIKSGTKITLTDFMRKRVPTKEELDRQLSYRFGIERSDWSVHVRDSESEVAFNLGELQIALLDGTKIDIADRAFVFEGRQLPMTGWIAYAKDPYKDDAMAGVRIYARGKIVAKTRDFDISAGFTGEYKLRSYLVGRIDADWLDEGEDLIRSDRQDIIWSSELGEAFAKWGQTVIKDVAKQSETSVTRAVWDEFLEVSDLEHQLSRVAPGDPEFRASVRDAARLLVSKGDRDSLKDQDFVAQIVRLAYSLGPHRRLLESLRQASESSGDTLGAVLGLFEQARVAEIYSLGQLAQVRVEVVDKLDRLVADGKTLERPLQELIESAPWLLAPEWTPIGTNESLKRVRRHFEQWYQKKHGVELVTSAIETPRKEPDFVLVHEAAELKIVEIKRIGYAISTGEFDTAINYRDSLVTFLDENPELGAQFRKVTLTFVVDSTSKLSATARSSLEHDTDISARTWHEVLDSTRRAHKDFLHQVEEMQQPELEYDADSD